MYSLTFDLLAADHGNRTGPDLSHYVDGLAGQRVARSADSISRGSGQAFQPVAKRAFKADGREFEAKNLSEADHIGLLNLTLEASSRK